LLFLIEIDGILERLLILSLLSERRAVAITFHILFLILQSLLK
jgi:hypothetical protein